MTEKDGPILSMETDRQIIVLNISFINIMIVNMYYLSYKVGLYF